MKYIENINDNLFQKWNTKTQTKWWKSYYPFSKDPYFLPIIKNSKRMNTKIGNNEINDLINQTLTELENRFSKIKNAWLQVYYPKQGINNFHSDGDLDRHVFLINTTDKMYNYEIKGDDLSLRNHWSNEWKTKSNIETFNECFLQQNENEIHIGKIGCIYSFGKTVHHFWNDSETERVAILFDLKEVEIYE